MDIGSVVVGICEILIRPKMLWVENYWRVMKYIEISSKADAANCAAPFN